MDKQTLIVGAAALAVIGFIMYNKAKKPVSTTTKNFAKKEDCSPCYPAGNLTCFYSKMTAGCQDGYAKCCAAA